MLNFKKLVRFMCPDYDNMKLPWKERVKEKGGWLWDIPEELQTEAEVLHDLWIQFLSEASKVRHSEERKVKNEIKEWIEGNDDLVKFKKRARLRYVKTQIAKETREFLRLRDKRLWYERAKAPQEVLISIEKSAQAVDKKIRGYEVEVKILNGRLSEREKKDLITDDMIDRAREYPIENLLELGRNGRARCIFHQGEDFNMDIRKNFAYCYVCGESGDPIKIYMQLHGASFREAVMALQ